MRYSPGSLIWNSEIAAFILQSNLPALWLISWSSALECDISLCHCVFAGQAFFLSEPLHCDPNAFPQWLQWNEWGDCIVLQYLFIVSQRRQQLSSFLVSYCSRSSPSCQLPIYMCLPSSLLSFWLWLLAPSPTSPDTFFRAQQHPHTHTSTASAAATPQKHPNPSTARQLRPSSLMRADGAVWAVELTTFTGANENDPSSLAGLSPHWPNFIMANYHGRPRLLCCCCCCLAPIYMDTWTH